jgi:hypothetical protein
MKREQIINTIKNLARSQGFYSRLYRAIEDAKENNPDAYEDFMTELEAQNFSDSVDLVLYLEC